MEDNGKIGSILVRAPNWIGDAVICLPALECLKGRYPRARITVLAKSRVIPVFENNPRLDGIIEYDDKGRHGGLKGRFRLRGEVRKRGFDMAVLFQNAFDAAFIAFISGIPERVGYARDLRTRLLTRPVAVTEEIKRRHQAHYYLNIVNVLGGQCASIPMPRLYVSEKEDAWALRFLEENSAGSTPVIGAAPGASYGPAKRWTAEGFAAVLSRLSAKYKAIPLIFGGRDDAKACVEVSGRINTRHIDLCGRTNLRESIALLRRLKVFITNDSGPMHLSAALGTPTVAIFGSTSPRLTGPLGEKTAVVVASMECSPCFDRKCRYGHYRCLTSIGADTVAEKAEALLNGAGDG
ncbi:MAG: lipopolysaccharide heptosyltransferase II [Deltaproteobacteria bacterium]|nr:lipopolysaccharide heptosyltransferase II [Deltaproteobacteria bacterium]